MELGDLPEDVVRFVIDQIESVPHLEALLLIWEDPSREWTEAEIAARVYVAPEAARAIAQDLVRRRFVLALSTSPVRYMYDPKWDEGQLMARVAATYRRNIVRVATLIHTKASRGVREFARAFQFKNDR